MLDHLSRVGPGEQRGDRRADGRASLVADVLLVDVLHAELLVELDFDDPPVRPHHVDFDRPVVLELDTAHLARASFGARRGDRSLAKGAGYLIMGERLAATKLFIKLTQLERGPEGHLDEGTVRSTYIDLPAVAIASGRIGQLGPGPVQREDPEEKMRIPAGASVVRTGLPRHRGKSGGGVIPSEMAPALAPDIPNRRTS